MRFFLPVQEAKTTEESYQAIKKFIETQTGWSVSDTRYYEIHYRRNDQDLYARVGAVSGVHLQPGCYPRGQP